MIDPTNRNTALATALVEELARCGIERAIASPGSRSSPVTLALEREPGIEVGIVLDERVAGFAALGAALSSGRPVVLSCTSGSAAANLHPAVVEADQAGVPLILLSSDRPPELRGIGAGQTIDQIKLFGDSIRWFCEIGTHEADDAGLLHYRASGCRAVGEATGGRGPVHLNLAWRDPLGPEQRPGDVSAEQELALEGRSEGRPLTVPISAREPTEPLTVAIAEALAGAERPLIVAGRIPNPGVAAAVGRLAAGAGIPLLAEPTSQLRYGPHDRSGVVAAYDLIVRDAPPELEPDLVLRFGDMPTSKALRQWLAAGPSPDQIVIDPPGRWDEPTRKAGALVRADAESMAVGLAERTRAHADRGWLDRWIGAEGATQKAIDRVLGAQQGPSEPALARALADLLADGEQLLVASSMPVRDAEAFARGGPADVRFHSNRGANGIDGLIATASGLALGSGRPTWALLGDLAVAHDLGGMAALALAPGPIRLVVADNGGGRIFEFLPQAEQVERERFARLFITPSPLELELVAGLFGLAYQRLDSLDELGGAREHERALIHIPLAAEGNVDLHRSLATATAEAVRGS